MVNIAFITTVTKGVAAVWSFLCFVLAAAMIGQFNSDCEFEQKGDGVQVYVQSYNETRKCSVCLRGGEIGCLVVKKRAVLTY